MNEIYFSQIREDSRVERQLQRMHSPRRMVCIGSGGCTAFSLLDEGAEHVFAVDVNRAQCALIELKKAAIRALDLEDYLGFIGERPTINRIEVYQGIKAGLPAYARQFWDHHAAKISHGINRSGVTERFYRFVGDNLRRSVCGEAPVREILSCSTLEDQRRVYEKHFTTESWKTALRVLFSKSTHLVFYPTFWLRGSDEDDFASFFAEQLHREVMSKLVSDNYFLSQLMIGSYLYDQPEGLPHYLSRDGFAAAKANLDRLTVVNEPMQLFLARTGDIDAFFLSNVFDWGKPAGQQSVCDAVLAAKSKQAVLLYRNMYAALTLPAPLVERFALDSELSERLLVRERSMLYRKVTTGIVH